MIALWAIVQFWEASQQCAGGIVDEQLAVSDVAAQHGVAGVAGLRPDPPGRDPGLGGASGDPGAQRVR